MRGPPVLDDNGDPLPLCTCCGQRYMRPITGSCWPPPCLYACPDCDLRAEPPDPPWPKARPHN